MAENKDYLQQFDFANQTVDGTIVQIAKEFVDDLTFLKAMPWKEATYSTHDVQVFEEPGKQWDPDYLTNLDKGGSPKKFSHYKREAYLGMFEGWAKWQDKQMAQVTNPQVLWNMHC